MDDPERLCRIHVDSDRHGFTLMLRGTAEQVADKVRDHVLSSLQGRSEANRITLIPVLTHELWDLNKNP